MGGHTEWELVAEPDSAPRDTDRRRHAAARDVRSKVLFQVGGVGALGGPQPDKGVKPSTIGKEST